MLEIRIHGRGGQGSFVAAQILAMAAFIQGYYALAFLNIGGGGDRRGAPVHAYVRMDKGKIRQRARIYHPDYVIVQDVSLLKTVNVLEGLKSNGVVLVNSGRAPEQLGVSNVNVVTIPASKIALEVIGEPITSTTILGAFVAIMKEISINSIKRAIQEKFPGEQGEKNMKAAQKAYEILKGVSS